MQPGRRFELMAVVLLLNVGGAKPDATNTAGGGRTRTVATAIR